MPRRWPLGRSSSGTCVFDRNRRMPAATPRRRTDEPYRPTFLRQVLAPAGMFVFLAYVALLAQQIVKFLAAKLLGAQVVALHLGLGRPTGESEWLGQRT